MRTPSPIPKLGVKTLKGLLALNSELPDENSKIWVTVDEMAA